ncbi:MAG: aminotransferase class III-fold pyridoxal phosphate-dependent enzyme [Clostridiaceae bacterium]
MKISECDILNARFNAVIPYGSSTCSKAAKYEPEEPYAVIRGKGCRIWDVDGKEFIDFRNALGPVTLGYRFVSVDDAIREQLDSGIVFGHPHPLECEVAEMLKEIIPCAQRVRFLKTGGEAVAACIRLARAYTGRDHIIQIGYNGWLNSIAPGSRTLPGQTAKSIPAGVPEALSILHHACQWNDIGEIERLYAEFDSKIAAIVVAADYCNMEQGKTFYPFLRDITRKNGSVLIFDEIVTGFRIAIGGVQEYFKVVPDLAVFSKGMANGMPISAYVGDKDIMACCGMGGNTAISSTFGGEALSLAAAKTVIETYMREDVISHLWKMGERMWSGLKKLFDECSIPMQCSGLWPCPTFVETDMRCGMLKDRFFRSAYKNGISLYNVSYVNYSHREEDIDEALDKLAVACMEIKEK